MELPGTELENDPDGNPCFGCGPRNPIGLRLRFFDDGEVVRAELEPRPEWAGWPEMWNLGLVIAGAIETSGWAAWERLGPNRPLGVTSLEFLGPIRLSKPLQFEARKAVEEEFSRVECRVLQEGVCVTKVQVRLTAMTRDEAEVALATMAIPRSLRPGFSARARGGLT
jgi:hypothetical protein